MLPIPWALGWVKESKSFVARFESSLGHTGKHRSVPLFQLVGSPPDDASTPHDVSSGGKCRVSCRAILVPVRQACVSCPAAITREGLHARYSTVILPPTRPIPRVAFPGFYLIPRRRRVAERLSPIQLVGEVVADEPVVFAMLGDLSLVTRVPATVSLRDPFVHQISVCKSAVC